MAAGRHLEFETLVPPAHACASGSLFRTPWATSVPNFSSSLQKKTNFHFQSRFATWLGNQVRATLNPPGSRELKGPHKPFMSLGTGTQGVSQVDGAPQGPWENLAVITLGILVTARPRQCPRKATIADMSESCRPTMGAGKFHQWVTVGGWQLSADSLAAWPIRMYLTPQCSGLGGFFLFGRL